MTRRRVGKLSQIASVRQSLELLAQDLLEKRSILLLLPAGVEPADLWSDLQTDLHRREFSTFVVSLPTLPDDRSPVIAISESLNVTWPSSDTPRTVANLMELDHQAEVIILGELHELHENGRQAWLAFLMQYMVGSRILRLGEAISILALRTWVPSSNSPARMRSNSFRFSSTDRLR